MEQGLLKTIRGSLTFLPGIALILILPFPAFSAGDEEPVQIRVSLSLKTPAVHLEANPHITISGMESGVPFEQKHGRFKVVNGSSGLTLNGVPTSLQEIQIQAEKGPIRINDLPVNGRLKIRREGGALQAINTLPLEEYLKGVVPVEVSAEWHPEVLKVQAIISRTYALFQIKANREKAYDLESSILDQVYRGTEREHPAANRAISETHGVILTYKGEVLQAFFHSTSAGPTEDASEVWGVDLPYLKGVSCPLDEGSPYFNWTASFPMTQLRSALIREGWRAGTIASVTPIRWTGAGRVDRIQILHSLGEIILKGNDFRRILGYSKLPSTRFIIQNVGPKLHVQGLGAGHAVGLCQWGAKQMAEMGYTHESILHHYYPGSKIQLTSDEPDIVLIP